MTAVRQRGRPDPIPERWPRDSAGRPLMRCPDYSTVGHQPNHWWGGHLRQDNPLEGVLFLYCPPPSPVAYGRSE